MPHQQPQQDLFSDATALVEITPRPKRKAKANVRKTPVTELLGVDVPALAPRPLLGRIASLWMMLLATVLCVALIDWFNSFWSDGQFILALSVLLTCALTAALTGSRLWREWRSAVQLNEGLARRMTAQQVMSGSPLVDCRAFCLSLLPPLAADEATIARAELWLDTAISSRDECSLVQAFILEFISPWQHRALESLQKRLPVDVQEKTADPIAWIVMMQRMILVTDEILAAHGIEPAWVVRWRVISAAVRYMAHVGFDSSIRTVPSLLMAAATIQSLLLPAQSSTKAA